MTWAPGYIEARNLSWVNQRGPRIAASLLPDQLQAWDFPHRTPAFNRTSAFNDPSRCQPVIGQIVLRIVKPHRTHPNFDPQTQPTCFQSWDLRTIVFSTSGSYLGLMGKKMQFMPSIYVPSHRKMVPRQSDLYHLISRPLWVFQSLFKFRSAIISVVGSDRLSLSGNQHVKII